MSKKKSKVVSMREYCENNGYFKSDKAEQVLEHMSQPNHMLIQNCLNNMRSQFTDAEIMHVVELLGMNQINLKKGA